MGYKLKRWLITDIRTGRRVELRAKSRRSLDKRLGKRVSEVLVERVK